MHRFPRPFGLIVLLGAIAACGDSLGPDGIGLLGTPQVAAGDNHSCFLDTAGIVRCWGWGALGQLGAGDTLNSSSPVQVEGGIGYRWIAVGSNHSCGIREDGRATCWGAAHAGELGNGISQGRVTTPDEVLGGSRFSTLSVGDGHTCGIALTGAALCWGEGAKGQLGNADIQDHAAPVGVATAVQFKSIAAGQLFTCGVSTQNSAHCWGDNTWGQLGNGVLGGTSATPVAVVGGHQFTAIYVGKSFVCALSTDRDAFCWGAASGGRLGNGGGADTAIAVPAPVIGGHKFEALALGRDHACGIVTDASAYCWGLNTYGKLGDDIGPSSQEPILVSGGLTFAGITVGLDHTCGVTTTGSGYCWGQNLIGQLGRSRPLQSSAPLKVVGL